MYYRRKDRFSEKEAARKGLSHRKARLICYDVLILLLLFGLQFVGDFAFGSSRESVSFSITAVQFAFSALMVVGIRSVCKVYAQVWRYSNAASYRQLLLADFVVIIVCGVSFYLVPWQQFRAGSIVSLLIRNFFASVAIRFFYTCLFEMSTTNVALQAFFAKDNAFIQAAERMIDRLTGISMTSKGTQGRMLENSKIRIGIVGAGRIGTMLAEELSNNPNAVYTPVCFIDTDKEKIGRRIAGIEVLAEGSDTKEKLIGLGVQEIVFTVNRSPEVRKDLFSRYKAMGFKIKVYTLPLESSQEAGRRQIREIDIEELLFRKQADFLDGQMRSFYRGKVILVSGGGGSIGSELSRQIAKMEPARLVLLDIYENNVYDIQQEMRLIYGDALNLDVEIASVRDAGQLDKVFRTYRPQIVLHAAAHKHVPLMEHNCSEAVKNNVFGTWNMVNVSEKYGVEKFIMLSTDKAVNPTNVMGASKRMCEMIVLSRAAQQNNTAFCCTRFGNVLGSNGSVVPLFKRQIANGGPVTLTDKRIIRYFMTIPEASQLVLTSGAMGKSGELFVLDMGRPVKILDLAENMIRLSGLEPYTDIEIVETGLRPGEKLFEEMLIQTEKLGKTDNEMIFIEQDNQLSPDEIIQKLRILESALQTGDDDQIRLAMKKVVPTFHSPQHVNRDELADGRYREEAEGRIWA